jgi:hypothetical protein
MTTFGDDSVGSTSTEMAAGAAGGALVPSSALPLRRFGDSTAF